MTFHWVKVQKSIKGQVQDSMCVVYWDVSQVSKCSKHSDRILTLFCFVFVFIYGIDD